VHRIKIVINSCFGGFGLSKKAKLLLYERGSKAVEATEPEKYYRGRVDWKKEFEEDRNEDTMSGMVVALDGKIITDERFTPELRADKELVKVVEELGVEANGYCAELKIVEVPDGIEWTIEEYDGTEWIAEKHETWR